MPEIPSQQPDRDPVLSSTLSVPLLISALLLVVVLFWSLYDELYGQRPWKKYQELFVKRYSALIKKELPVQAQQEKQIRESPEFQKLQQELTAADIPVLIGTNTDETSFFTSTVPPIAALSRWPVVGQRLTRAIIRRTTAAVYGAATDQFARRHAQAGGTAHRYRLTWSATGNRFGSTHGIDVALLFGTEESWSDAAMLAGASWDEIEQAGSAVRALWADFARGIALPAHLDIPGVLTLDRVVSTARTLL
jgi:carboxylesterase type B